MVSMESARDCKVVIKVLKWSAMVEEVYTALEGPAVLVNPQIWGEGQSGAEVKP